LAPRVKTIDEYVTSFPEDVQAVLQEIRRTIRECAPKAEETISYRIPTFKLHGNLVHFAAFKDHIGFFPTSSARAAFPEELSKYKGGKGTIQFPLDEPIPYELIRKIVRYRVKESSPERKVSQKKKNLRKSPHTRAWK
jgi:uncharacterized protein YdhG (YjbR/CyaY superfamily)